MTLESKTKPFPGRCPKSHPYTYLNGRYCCQSNKEKVYRPDGSRCDGSKIQKDSSCCEGDRYTRCRYGNCENSLNPGYQSGVVYVDQDYDLTYSTHTKTLRFPSARLLEMDQSQRSNAVLLRSDWSISNNRAFER